MFLVAHQGPVVGWIELGGLWVVLGAATSMINTPSARLLRRNSTLDNRTAVFTAQFSLSHACFLLTYPIAGWIGALFGQPAAATVLARLLPSLNFPRPSVTDATDAVRPAQLRGLSPDHTLVLVNGKRRHTTSILNSSGTQGRGSAPVDLNAIPLAAATTPGCRQSDAIVKAGNEHY